MTTIRPYRQQDREELRRLVLQLHETMRPFDADLAPGEEIIERYFRDLFSKLDQTAGAVFVAENDNRMVGYVCVFGSLEPEDLDERPDSYSFMAELFVLPGLRNRGIGDLLVQQAESFARECGTYKLELKVLARNEEAVRFYEAHGYAPRIVVMSKRM